MAYRYPYGNTEQMNLDWFLKKFRELQAAWDQVQAEGVIEAAEEARRAANEAIAAAAEAVETAAEIVQSSSQIATNTQNIDNLSDTVNNLDSADIADNSNAGGPTVEDSLTALKSENDDLQNIVGNGSLSGFTATDLTGAANELKGSLNTLPANRLKGKKIALYGDSWSTGAYGSLGREYIESITGVEMHVSALGSQTMAQIYSGLWDSYNADIYIIEGGLNDKSLNIGGTPFINAIHSFTNAIRQVNSNAEIYFVTPPKTKTSAQYNALFPLEFYRIVIWRLAAIDGFNVINALKWTDINLRDDLVHPTADSEEKIGKHIVQALINYGDEETHIQEFSNLNSAKNNEILFFCSNGDMQIKLQAYNTTADAANNVNQSLGNIDTVFAPIALPIVNGSSGSGGLFMYDNTSPNYLRFYVYGMAQGATFNGGNGFLPVTLQAVSYTGG